jgi:hypothetical protein
MIIHAVTVIISIIVHEDTLVPKRNFLSRSGEEDIVRNTVEKRETEILILGSILKGMIRSEQK